MKDLERIRETIKEKINSLRSIENIINSVNFESLWVLSKKEEINDIKKCIRRSDKIGTKNWIKNHPSIELGEMPLRQLKELAREKKIINYSRLNRLDLLVALQSGDGYDMASEELVAEIDERIKEISFYFEKMGLSKDYFTVPEDFKILKEDDLLLGYDWLTRIYDDPYSKVKKIRDLLPEEVWDRYEKWEEFESAEESILFKKALANFKKAITSSNRPNIFKKRELRKMIKNARKNLQLQS